jgi:hypothetical protein
MNHGLRRTLCHLLIALMAWAPFQISHAGIIATDQALHSSAPSDRAHVLGLLDRADIAKQLQTFGLDSSVAKDRVNAMTDQEVSSLASKLEALPAGAKNDAGVLILIIIIVAVIWWAVGRPGMSGR